LLHVQDDSDSFDLRATPDGDDGIPSPISASATAFTPLSSTAGGSKAKAEATSKTSSRASAPSATKSRTLLKRTLQDAFAEGSAKENQVLERLATQKHERAIGELELKRRKLENKAMEKQHQREREREQHEFRVMQMRMMMAQNQQSGPAMMQSRPQNQSLFDGFGLMELNGSSLASELASESPSVSLSPFSA